MSEEGDHHTVLPTRGTGDKVSALSENPFRTALARLTLRAAQAKVTEALDD